LSVAVSFAVHLAAIVVMFFIKMSLPDDALHLVLDSVFSEERLQEEFEQEVEQSNQVAESMNIVESHSLSTAAGTGAGGTGGTVVAQQKIEEASSLKEPTVPIRVGEIAIPSANFVAEDLGTGTIKGDIGRVVEGYGPALSQLTQELVRLMREQKLTVVWLFDESESMRDDQKEIRGKFHKVYEELGLVAKSDAKLKLTDEILLTSVMSFGDNVTEHTPNGKPTAKTEDVRAAIDKIQIEQSGKENMCKAVSSAIAKYGPMTQKQRRRLAIVVVSDESGDDGELIEDTIERCRKFKAPVYILGRYSCFGYPYARMTWVDPKYGLTWWLTINRGPETPFPELLQTDGLHERWDYDSAGFGPYEQVRLARESGGIFFILPGTEDNISGTRSIEDRRFDLLDMKEYLPDLSARVVYAQARDSSKFRAVQWQVINVLNPHKDSQLQIQEIHYSADPVKFAEQGAIAFQKAVRSLQLFNEGLRLLDAVKPLRAKEPSQRWRANYDLIHAQCKAYRVRLFQFALALDQHQKNKPDTRVVNNVKNNMWNIVRQPVMLPPDPLQVKLTKIDLDELNKQMDEAREEFEAVIRNHPRTPWARRAERELAVGFGMKFVDGYWNFDAYAKATDVKLPTP
jgi:hypothetical protein